MKVTGYTDKLSVEPGERLELMVSSEAESYRADLVRLIHGDTSPRGPGFKSEIVPAGFSGHRDGRVQELRPGSYVRVPAPRFQLDPAAGIAIEAWIYPTTPGKERQVLLSRRGAFELALAAGRLELRVGDAVAQLSRAIEHPAWFFVSASYDGGGGRAELAVTPLDPTVERRASAATISLEPAAAGARSDADLILAAAESGDGLTDFFNGKLEAPRIVAAGRQLARWDFSLDISSRAVRDVSGNGLHGRTVNFPTRGVTGRNWDGTEMAWPHAPEQYGAIHFHDDDLDDAGWEVDFSFTVDPDTPSGIYAVRLEADGERDHVPFFVRRKEGSEQARILFLAPVFSYLAYGNEHVMEAALLTTPEARERWQEGFAERFPDAEVGAALRDYPSSPEDRYILENRLLSLYDKHGDASGVCYSSWLRPLLNMRPDYVLSILSLGAGAPHQLGADLHLVDWLHHYGYRFDVATDIDLHLRGAQVLAGYDAVITGSHPEYTSGEMLDALRAYVDGGGNLMSMGANGYYWVTQLDPEEGHTVEIRRAPPAGGTWRTEPGEGFLSTTGEPGGLWRSRGRPPQRLMGVGMISMGAGPGRPYERRPGSHDPRVAFIFDGVAGEELIGDFPNLVNDFGAAGMEIDRLDYQQGTPGETILLATASNFSDAFKIVLEESLDLETPLGDPEVRADLTYTEHLGGGAVFSTGSIAWCGCLSYNEYDNNVSRITRNVLDHFAPEARSRE